jgi:hypothetical protein
LFRPTKRKFGLLTLGLLVGAFMARMGAVPLEDPDEREPHHR